MPSAHLFQYRFDEKCFDSRHFDIFLSSVAPSRFELELAIQTGSRGFWDVYSAKIQSKVVGDPAMVVPLGVHTLKVWSDAETVMKCKSIVEWFMDL